MKSTMDFDEVHIIRSSDFNIAFHSRSLAVFKITNKFADVLIAYKKFKSITKASRITGVSEKEIQDILHLLYIEIKDLKDVPEYEKDINFESIQLTLLVSHNCNLKCRYCFAQESYKEESYMSLETAKKAVKMSMRLYPGKIKTILFFGGEPLLNFEVIKEVVNFTCEFCQINNIKMPQFGIVTNGVLLTPKIVDFLQKNNFMVTVSLDGPPEINNYQRIFSSGKGTYEHITKGIKCLKERRLNFNIEATFTRKHIENNLSVKLLLLSLHSLGADAIHIAPVFGMYANDMLIPKTNIEKVANSFKDAALYSIDSLLTKDPLQFQYCYYLLECLIKNVSIKHLCFAGIRTLSVFANGDIYPCYLLLDDNLFMGNIFENSFPDKNFFKTKEIMLNTTKDYLTLCKKCWARNLCSSCYGFKFSLSKSLSSPPIEFCFIQKGIIEGTLLGLSKYRANLEFWPRIVESITKKYLG